MKKSILMAAVAITSITCLAESGYAIGLLLPAIQKVRQTADGNAYTITFSDILVSSFQSHSQIEARPTYPVLMVISNQHLWDHGLADTRCSFECSAIEYFTDGRHETLFVAGTFVEKSNERRPQLVPFAGELYLNPADPNEVIFEFRFKDSPEVRHTIVFVGGWGSSMYQYDFSSNYE